MEEQASKGVAFRHAFLPNCGLLVMALIFSSRCLLMAMDFAMAYLGQVNIGSYDT